MIPIKFRQSHYTNECTLISFLLWLHLIQIKANMSCAILGAVYRDSVSLPGELPALLKAGAEAWPSTSDTGSARDNTEAALPLLACQDH